MKIPASTRRSVVLPDPLGPISAMPSPRSIENVTSRRPQVVMPCAPQPSLSRRHDSQMAVEEELNPDAVGEDHQTTFAN